MKTQTQKSGRAGLKASQGAITIFQMFELSGLVSGMFVGFVLCSHLGKVSAIIGGVLGGILGFMSGRLPLICAVKWLRRDLSGKSVAKLRAELHNPDCLMPNVFLLELGSRGEKMDAELPVILGLLCSPVRERRIRGWQALASVFPERARLISDYRVDDPIEQCKEKVQKILPIPQ
jgi:hypothetical protein